MGKLKEIRIYCESLEQGNGYFQPIVEKICKELRLDTTIKLVKLLGNYKYYSRNIAPIIYWKDTDVLISVIIDDEEHPLFAIELSLAVFTEDHELQRFDALLSPILGKTIPVKISPLSKQSDSQHGGNTDFNYISPYSLIKNQFGMYCFHFDWKCDENNNVIINSKNISCPQENKNFEKMIEIGIKCLENFDSKEKWILDTNVEIKKIKFFSDWFSEVDKGILPIVTSLSSSRLCWIVNEPTLKMDVLELKLNRFGHAMDPERGMIPFYSYLSGSLITKMQFNATNGSWYKDISSEEKIKKHISLTKLQTPYDFLYCFALGSGLDKNEKFMDLIKKEKSEKTKIILDLSKFVNENYQEFNKPLRTIFGFSDLFIIEDSNKQRQVEIRFKRQINLKKFNNFPNITSITTPTQLTEDEVTYIIVHNVFKQNQIIPVSISYPGAQGDRVILVEAGTGRKQKRKYVDIIATKNSFTFLHESKGPYSKKMVQDDIDEIQNYKTEKKYKDAIRQFHIRYTGFFSSGIVTGVSFWGKSFTVEKEQELKLQDLNYYIIISKDKKTWLVKEMKGSNFDVKTGTVTLPEYFEISH